MSTTLLEQTRGEHEEIEKMERLIVKDFKREAKTHKDKLNQNHRVRKRIDTIQQQAVKLARIYEDDDGARKEDIASLAADKDNPYSTFYARLKEVRDYYRKYPSQDFTEAEDDEPLLREEAGVEFSGEESLGRYLDLQEHYRAFLNLKLSSSRKATEGNLPIEYQEYLGQLTEFSIVPKPQRLSKAYREYLKGLLAYLESFFERTRPLESLPKVYRDLEESFEAAFEAGSVPGWEDKGQAGADEAAVSEARDLVEGFESPADLLDALDATRLKEALQALGLKAGGTPQQRAERLMMTKGRDLKDVDRKHFAKGVVRAGPKDAAEGAPQRNAAQETALLESRIVRVLDALEGVLEATRDNIEKKQARTYEELQAEQMEADQDGPEEDSDEDDEFIYNPLKLPLGWDGKPIPYWLYKLHGLNQEFKCEICGNYSYWGRRAFERHFKEFRHQNGMRSLGIPNNKNFFEVTQMKDALALWQNIQEREKGGFVREVEEEFEDADGNVYNRKTYEDLKRQGLI